MKCLFRPLNHRSLALPARAQCCRTRSSYGAQELDALRALELQVDSTLIPLPWKASICTQFAGLMFSLTTSDAHHDLPDLFALRTL